MPVTNISAIKFSDEKIRPMADQLAKAYFMAKQVRSEWYANNMGTLFPNGGGNVEDSSSLSGRHPITADDVTLLMARVDELVADYEANNSAKLNTIMKPAVNPL